MNKKATINKTLEKEERYDKNDLNESFIMDINIIQRPMCRYSKNKTSVKDLLEEEKLSTGLKNVLKSKGDDILADLFTWEDSNGVKRAVLLTTQNRNLPTPFSMEVLYGLIGLYVKKNTPIKHLKENDKKTYIIPTNELRFSINELRMYMGLKGGSYHERIKEAIRSLYDVSIHSLEEGALYDPEKGAYMINKERGLNWIESYDFSEVKRQDELEEQSFVKFSDLIINSIKSNYIRFLDHDTYFALRSGLSRRLYSYIKGNSVKGTKYLKSSLNTLNNLLPLECKYQSRIKARLKGPLNNLLKEGAITDYFFGDEIIVNGKSEPYIYFLFNGYTKAQLITDLKEKKDKNIEKKTSCEVKEKKLEFPTNFKQELKDIGISEPKVKEILSRFSGKKKYELAEYILWIKEMIAAGKANNPASLFMYAITPQGEVNENMVCVERTHKHICDFVKEYKDKKEGDSALSQKKIEKEFKSYSKKIVNEFKKSEEAIYMNMAENLDATLKNVCKAKMDRLQEAINKDNGEDKTSVINLYGKFEEYERLGQASELFCIEIEKRIRLYKNNSGEKFLDFEEFKRSKIRGSMN